MEQLLSTKLYIPATRKNLVSRPRLIEKMNDGLRCHVTLISAPAGFGKTTLVSEWVEQLHNAENSKNAVGWLSLEENDNDPVRFLNYVIGAMRHAEGINSDFGRGALGILQSPQPPPTEAVLISLINDIAACSGTIILILDDYHAIDSSGVNAGLSFLLEHQPPNLHLVITTRVDPQLPLARLRASGQLNELRGTELRFTSSEVSDFLNKAMGLNLSAEDIAALENRTEGWIAGLQLAAITMRGREDTASLIKSFTGSHRLVLDYLLEEVLEQQSEQVQHFLLHTAVLNRLNGALCDTLTGQENGQATLEMLEHANLFIVPLDEERRWYRYHHLFSDLLRQRLQRTNPGDIPILHQRASTWYRENGFTDEAIEHAIKGNDLEQAVVLIEDQADVIWKHGEHAKLFRWLDYLPNEVVLSKPQLGILQAWNQFTKGQQGAAENTLLAAEKSLGSENEFISEPPPGEESHLSDFDRAKILGRAATIRAFLAFHRGDIQNTNKFANLAVELLPEQDLSWRATALVALGDAYMIVGDLHSTHRVQLQALEVSKKAGNTYMVLVAGMKLLFTLRWLGDLDEVLKLCKQQLKLANEYGMSKIMEVSLLFGLWSDVFAEIDKLDEALVHAKKGVELAERGKEVGVLGWSYLRIIRTLFSRGDLSGVEEYIQKINDFSLNYQVPHWVTYRKAAWQVRVWLLQDKLDTAIKWADELGLDIEGLLTYHNERDYISYARILIAQGREDEAIRILDRLLEASKISGNRSRALEVLNLKALALQEQGDQAQALATLQEAFKLAEPEGFIRTFVDEGPSMARLLLAAVSQEVAPDYANRLLAAVRTPEFQEIDQEKSQAKEVELIEALSQREIEVLQLISSGLTNQEIAARLYLSINTVKVHTRNIFEKIGVNNRTHAAARAKALGILPPD